MFYDISAVSVVQLVVAWLLVVGAARRCQVELNHYAVHNRLLKGKDANRRFVEVVSTLLFIQDFEGYHRDHVLGHHRGDVFCGPEDADWVFLQGLGLRLGMTVTQCWIWLATTCFSPRFHATFLAARARSNFLSKNRYRRVMTVAWLSTVVAATTALDAWVPVLALLVFPLTLLYQVSALVQFTCEHYWGAPFVAGETPAERHARLSHARYCLTPLPRRNGDGLPRFLGCLLLWALTVALVDIPARVAIIVGELPAHDRHHRYPPERHWAMVMYLHEDDHVAHRSRECWGLVGALNAVFRHVHAMGPPAA